MISRRLLSVACPLFVAALAAAPARAGGGIAFPSAQFVPQIASCPGVALADLDADGRTDLLYIGDEFTYFSNTFQHLSASQGKAGTLFGGDGTTFGSGYNTMQSLIATDLDGDGFLDAAAALGIPDGALLVWHDAQGAGWPPLAAGEPDLYDLNMSAAFVVAGDVDGDGDADLVVVLGDRFRVATNAGDATFSLGPELQLPSNIVALRLGDLDADGAADLVVALADQGIGSGGPTVEVHLSLGTGGFAAASQVFQLKVQTSDGLALADMDADGALDLSVGESNGVVWAKGTGAGSFLPPAPAGGQSVRRLLVDDVDADGAPDLVVGGTDAVTSLLGHGDGTFTAGASLPLPGPIPALASGDINGDGRRDVVASCAVGLALLENLGEGDFAGAIDVPCPTADLAVVLTPPAVADMDGDGDPEVLVGNKRQPQIFDNPGPGGAWGAPLTLSQAQQGSRLVRVLAGDLDAASGADVVALSGLYGTVNAAHVWLQQAGGVFAAPVATGLAQPATDGELGDLDLDGDLDLVVAAGPVACLFNDGAGGFAGPEALPWSAKTLALADLDADGVADLMLQAWDKVKVCEGLGDGNFVVRLTSLVAGLDGEIRAGDANGDALPDFVVALPGGAEVFTNLAGFAFGLHAWGSEAAGDAQLADLDGQPGNELLLLPTSSGAAGGEGHVQVLSAVAGGYEPQGRYWLRATATGSCTADVDADGAPDLVAVTNEGLDSLVTLLPSRRSDPWQGLAGGLAGTHGLPELSGSGPLLAATPVGLSLVSALEVAPVVLVVGTSVIQLPFKGGTLVPQPTLLIGLMSDAAGSVHLAATWPAGLPSGFSIALQAWIADATGIQGYAASNALLVKIP